jgi:hypothetical protein
MATTITETDLYQLLVLQNDGQAIDTDDINNRQLILQSRMFEQLFERMAPGDFKDPQINGEGNSIMITDVPEYFAYALTGSSAMMIPGSTNAGVKMSPGTLFQKVAASTGLIPQFLPFTFAGTEELTFSNGDVSNPRVDIIQMALSFVDGSPSTEDFQDAVTGALSSVPGTNTSRKVQCVLSIKQGTAAATPTVPTADAGAVMVAAMVIPTAYAWANPWTFDDSIAGTAYLFDHRMPLGVTAIEVSARQYYYDASAWNDPGLTGTLFHSGGAVAVVIPCPVGRHCGRIVGVEMEQQMSSATLMTLGSRSVNGTSSTFAKTVGRNNTVIVGSVGGAITNAWALTGAERGLIETNGPGSTGYGGSCPTFLANSNKQGACLWSNGLRGATRFWFDNTASLNLAVTSATGSGGSVTSRACMFNTAVGAGQTIGNTTWYVAGA